jgi:uncharacterized NAD(P)/FAD-binding protein YdhS
MAAIRTIAVVGNGASGAMVCRQLLHQAGPFEIHIEWIGKAERFGPGFPYTTQDPDHRLNVRAEGMSAFPQEAGHFLEWASRHDSSITARSYAPRGLYGNYLEALVPRDPRLSRRQAEVVDLDRENGEYVLRLADGGEVRAREVALAPGLPPRQSAFGAESPEMAASVEPGERVLLLGTGLTMADTVATLCRHPARVPVWAVSRHALLPRAHADYPPYSPSPEFSKWLAQADLSLGQSFRLFRSECQAAMAGGSDWRAVFPLIRPFTPKIWQGFGVREKTRFLRHCARWWDAHRHRMAPEIAARIEAWQAEKKLLVKAGRVKRLARQGNARKKVWQLELASSEGILKADFDRVLDCTGLLSDLRQVESLLLRQLLRKGMLLVDEPPIGAQVNGTFPGLYLLGPLLRGRDWESIAVPELRLQAREVAETILSRIKAD